MKKRLTPYFEFFLEVLKQWGIHNCFLKGKSTFHVYYEDGGLKNDWNRQKSLCHNSHFCPKFECFLKILKLEGETKNVFSKVYQLFTCIMKMEVSKTTEIDIHPCVMTQIFVHNLSFSWKCSNKGESKTVFSGVNQLFKCIIMIEVSKTTEIDINPCVMSHIFVHNLSFFGKAEFIDPLSEI